MTDANANSIFIDTNILVYANIKSSPMHNAALSAIEKLYRANKPIWISRQVIREYISILSRPQTFSQPLTAQTIARRIEFFQRKFNVADDNA